MRRMSAEFLEGQRRALGQEKATRWRQRVEIGRGSGEGQGGGSGRTDGGGDGEAIAAGSGDEGEGSGGYAEFLPVEWSSQMSEVLARMCVVVCFIHVHPRRLACAV